MLILAVPAGFVIVAAREPILTLLTKPIYAERSAYLVPMLVVATILYGVSILVRNIFILAHETTKPMWWAVAAACVKIALALILVPRLGIDGAALSTVVAYVFLVTALVALSMRLMPWRLRQGVLVRILAAAAVAAVPFLLVERPDVPLLAGLCCLYGVIYTAGLFLTGVVKIEEVRRLRALLRQRPPTDVVPDEEAASADSPPPTNG